MISLRNVIISIWIAYSIIMNISFDATQWMIDLWYVLNYLLIMALCFDKLNTVAISLIFWIAFIRLIYNVGIAFKLYSDNPTVSNIGIVLVIVIVIFIYDVKDA